MIKQIFIIIILSTAIFLLNYAGIPEYTAALAIAFAGGLSLLRRNQSGKIREKLALVAALAAGCIAYFMISGQAYGVYAGAAAFLAVGFSLTRIYKSKSDYRVWLMEVFPVLLRFVMFERIGGAISGLGHTFTISGFSVSVRYVEAFILMIAFCVFQSKENGHKYGKRVLAVPKLKGLKPFGKVVIAAALLVIWFNPFNMLVIDNIKNSIMDSLANFGTERSTISMISDSTGTSLLKVKSDTAVTSESAAYKLLTSYDKELGGEFVFISSEKLPSGNTVYSFSQISNDIPILGGVKKLVVGLDNKPLYIVGETRTGVTNLRKPQNGISEQQAISQMNSFLDGNIISLGNAQKAWMYSSNSEESAYNLVYTIPAVVSESDGADMSCNFILSALSGEIVDITGLTLKGQLGEELAAIFAEAQKNGKFKDSDFETILESANLTIADTESNAWLYTDILSQECQTYYTNNGDGNLGKKNANAIRKAFSNAGVDGKNADEGAVSVDMKSTAVSVKGKIDFAYDRDVALVSHSGMTTQQYTFKTDVPVALSVSKENGEVVLSIPVFDEETFEIYPTGQDERYVVTVLGGSNYQTKANSPAAPVIPGTLSVQLLDALWGNWLTNTENASYSLSVKQLNSDLRITNGTTINKMLDKITSAYNSGNGSRFISLYRFDEISELFHNNYYTQISSAYGKDAADILDKAASSHSIGIAAQAALVYYRIYNATFAKLASEYSVLRAFNKAVSDNPDKTFIAFVLFGLQGNVQNRSNNFTPNFLKLDGSALALNYKGSEVKGDKTFISVDAVISKNGSVLIGDTVTLVLQHFGDAPSTITAEGGNWFSDIVDGVSGFLASGDYLGLDLSGVSVPEWRLTEPAKVTTLISIELVNIDENKIHNSLDDLNGEEYAKAHDAWYKWLSAYWYADTQGYDMIRERSSLSIKSLIELLFRDKMRTEEMFKSLFETLGSISSYESELSDIIDLVLDSANTSKDIFEFVQSSKTLLFSLQSLKEINKYSRRLTNASTLKILEAGKRLGMYNPDISSKATELLERFNNTRFVSKQALQELSLPSYLTDTMFTPRIGWSTYYGVVLSSIEFAAEETALKNRLKRTIDAFREYESDFNNIFSLDYVYAFPENQEGTAAPSQGYIGAWNEAPKFEFYISDAWKKISKQYNELGKNNFNFSKASQYYADIALGCIPAVAAGSVIETSWGYIRAVLSPEKKITVEETVVANTISNMMICYDIKRVIAERKAAGIASISDDKVSDAISIYLEIAWSEVDRYCGVK